MYTPELRFPEAHRRQYCFGEFKLDLEGGALLRGAEEVPLRRKSFEVLTYLVERHGRIVGKEELIAAIWPDAATTDNSLAQCLLEVRRALSDDSQTLIRTVSRRGYIFKGVLSAPVEFPQGHGEGIGDDTSSATGKPWVRPRSDRLNSNAAVLAVGVGVFALAGLLAFTGIPVRSVFGGWGDHLLRGGSPQIRSLAVLPFQNMSGDPGQEYFSDGTTEQLITDLAQIRTLKVISRTSAMHYKNSTKSLPEIGRELGVDAVVEGSVRRSENRVRVTAQLVRAATDGHLWAKDYDRDVSDLLKLEADVAREIAQEIRVQLTPEEAASLARVQTASSSAEEEFWRGRRYQDQGSDEDLKRAIEHYSEAVQIQPDYALAYAGLANAWAQLRATNHSEAEANAQKAASRALELGPDLGETHVAIAMIDTDRWNWQEADREFQAALRLDPTNVESCGCYAFFLSLMRRYPEAIALLNRGSQIDPLSPVIQQVYGMALSASGNPEEAIPHLQRALELDPGNYTAGNFLAAIYENSGKFQDALKVLSRPQFESSASHARLYALLGRKDEARAILKKVAERAYPSHLDVASIYFALGEEDQGFEWLNKGLDSHDPFIVRMTMSATLNGVRSDPRYQKLVARLTIPRS